VRTAERSSKAADKILDLAAEGAMVRGSDKVTPSCIIEGIIRLRYGTAFDVLWSEGIAQVGLMNLKPLPKSFEGLKYPKANTEVEHMFIYVDQIVFGRRDMTDEDILRGYLLYYQERIIPTVNLGFGKIMDIGKAWKRMDEIEEEMKKGTYKGSLHFVDETISRLRSINSEKGLQGLNNSVRLMDQLEYELPKFPFTADLFANLITDSLNVHNTDTVLNLVKSILIISKYTSLDRKGEMFAALKRVHEKGEHKDDDKLGEIDEALEQLA